VSVTYYTLRVVNKQEENKWATIKILTSQKIEIEKLNEKTRNFVNVPNFVGFAIRKELDGQRRRVQN